MKKILLIVLLFSFFTVVNAETRVLDLNDKYIYELPGITIEANYNLDNTFHLTAKNVTDAYTCTGVLYAYEQKDVNSLIAKGPIYMDLSPNDNIRVLILPNTSGKKVSAYSIDLNCNPILTADTDDDGSIPITTTGEEVIGIPDWAYVMMFTSMGFGVLITVSVIIIIVKMIKKGKKKITSDSFYTVMSENMFSMQDITGEYNNVIRATRAVNPDNIEFDFFEFTDSSYIQEVINSKIESIRNGDDSVPMIVSINGFSGDYSQSSVINGIYYYFLKKGNVLLFATCSEDKRKELKNILKKIY